MMAERGDFQLLHEPFSYLAEFGETEVAGRRLDSERALIAAIRALSGSAPVFFKDTTDERYPDLLADGAFLGDDATHTFIIRDPRETIASYFALNPLVRRDQIGFETLHEIFHLVWRLTGRVPAVIDAGDMMASPEAVIQAYCAHAGISYLPLALSWRPGARQEWQKSQRWHAEVALSRGFESTPGHAAVDVERHPVLGAYLRYQLPFYEELREVSLKPMEPAR
jgi:hypothetical protein